MTQITEFLLETKAGQQGLQFPASLHAHRRSV